MNKLIYIITIIISIILMIPSIITNNTITALLSSIGCSGVAAAIMAIFLDYSNEKREKKKLQSSKKIYFESINNELNMLIGRIIWYDERMNDDNFDWDQPPSLYSSFKYMVAVSSNYTNEKTLTYSEAIELLLTIGEKYTLEKQTEMASDQLDKVRKMFIIIVESCKSLLLDVNTIKNNKLTLNQESYISLEDVDSLLFSISLALGIMINTKKNYKVAINEIITASKLIRKIGNYDNCVCQPQSVPRADLKVYQ